MDFRVVLAGMKSLFTDSFRETVAECGFEPVEGGDGSFDIAPDEYGLYVFAVEGPGCLGLIRPAAGTPFMVFSPEALAAEALSGLKGQGLLGAVTPGTAREDVAFLLNRAFFSGKMVERNPRAPVNMPVVLTSGARVVNTFASLLSRDGMFVVTLNPLDVNALCTIRFALPGGREFSTGARVLYRVAVNKDLNIISNPRDRFKRMVSHPGMAVFFTDLPEGDRDEIGRFVETVL